nr:MAG TPA: protein of unknown function (DUF3846) [Caudoviricetes sp.]
MKTLKITTDNKISVVDVNFSDFKAIQQAIGGYFEIVNTQKLRDYFKASVVMIVDEEGVIKDLPVNTIGCYFYNTSKHGCPIAGDMILGLLVGPDITGLGDRDAEQWMEKMLKDFPILKRGDE